MGKRSPLRTVRCSAIAPPHSNAKSYPVGWRTLNPLGDGGMLSYRKNFVRLGRSLSYPESSDRTQIPRKSTLSAAYHRDFLKNTHNYCIISTYIIKLNLLKAVKERNSVK